uniref:Uncharacterized protein n=1 Tax=Quercus lobata TaxID=97700 RepID=A0A7N2MQ74_QUELO
MADEVALDLEELRHLQSIAKRPRVLSLISSQIDNLDKGEMGFVDCGGRPVKKQRKTKRKKTKKKDTDER